MDYGFTAGMEEDLDRIADGKIKWQKEMKSFGHHLQKTCIS